MLAVIVTLVQRAAGSRGGGILKNNHAKANARIIDYMPCFTTAGGSIDLGRGGVNVPWENKLTPVHVASAEERAMIDASMAVIVESWVPSRPLPRGSSS